MNDPTLTCRDEVRRAKVRASRSSQDERRRFNGLDFLEVSDEPEHKDKPQRFLKIHMLGKVPANLKKENIVIAGGRRITDIEVLDYQLLPNEEDGFIVEVDQAGDFSPYTLKLVALEGGQPTDFPFEGIDPRYAQVQFTFKADCPSDLDCKPREVCPPEKRDTPEIDYLAKDYASFRQLLLDRLSQTMPGWKERHVPDLGISMVELLAYAGDRLSYYQDAVATEAYLSTARQRLSVRRHARLVDYNIHEGCNARAWVAVEADQKIELDPKKTYFITPFPNAPGTGTVLSQEDLRHVPKDAYVVFEPLLAKPQLQRFTLADMYDAASLADKWATHATPLAQYIYGRLSATTKDLLNFPLSSKLKEALVEELNRLLAGGPIYEQQRFAGLDLSEETLALLAANPRGSDLQRLNRLLLEEAYPKILGRSLRALLQFHPQHNTIHFYAWGDKDCCLPRGATSATLIDNDLRFNTGDVLIFEEVKGPKSGDEDDADQQHRHAVRLTRVAPGKDKLCNVAIVHIEWAEEDALPFPLCISAIGSAPECRLIERISVARGNVVLVDHGRTITEALGEVQLHAERVECKRESRPEDTLLEPEPFRPRLQETPLTFSQPLALSAPASEVLKQDPRKALPQIDLMGTCLLPGGIDCKPWETRRDLLGSRANDNHFVVEMDNDGRGHLRFGDDETGQRPEVGTKFDATYRVGNGLSGNVGAETISYVVHTGATLSGLALTPRNPFPAQGGLEPELLSEVKLYASTAFRKQLERAVTTEDYVEIAQRHPRVQRAAATFRWMGSWYEVLVAIDPFGRVEDDDELLNELRKYLHRYRRMGHDLVVARAAYIPIFVKLVVCVKPTYLRGHVKAELLDLFGDEILPDGRLGFFHPDNLSFGESIRLSHIVAAAQRVPGVENVVVDKLERMFEGPNGEVENGFLPLGPLEIARLDNDPSFPENGRLELDLRGGR